MKIQESRRKDAGKCFITNLWRSDVVTIFYNGIIKLTQRQKSAES